MPIHITKKLAPFNLWYLKHSNVIVFQKSSDFILSSNNVQHLHERGETAGNNRSFLVKLHDYTYLVVMRPVLLNRNSCMQNGIGRKQLFSLEKSETKEPDVFVKTQLVDKIKCNRNAGETSQVHDMTDKF